MDYLKELSTKIKKLSEELNINANNAVEELYESKRHELESIERNNIAATSITNQVGIIQSGHEVKKHLSPMLSMQHTYDINIAYKKVTEWLQKDTIILQEKIDGIALSLQYNNGILQCALLRGDGQQGENVIRLCQDIQSIPANIGFMGLVEIRGELYVNKGAMQGHIRSVLSGAVRRHNPDATHINFIAYSISTASTQLQTHMLLSELGFVVPELHVVTSLQQFKDIYAVYAAKEFAYETDGVVIKLNNISNEYTSRYRKNVFAIKYTRAATITRVTAIEMTLNRQSCFVPVIHIAPVMIDNMCITKVAGHNYAFLRNKRINVDAKVSICRVGNTAPQIINVVEGVEPYCITHCTFCKQPVSVDDINARCMNDQCEQKLRVKAAYFLAALGIAGLGDSIINSLIDRYGSDLQQLVQGIYKFDWVHTRHHFKIQQQLLAYKPTYLQIMVALGWPQISKSTLQANWNEQTTTFNINKRTKIYTQMLQLYTSDKPLIERLYKIMHAGELIFPLVNQSL
jgi:DNA ligase (NAD+)